MTPEEIVEACEERGIRLVRFLYCDNGGIVRGKMAHVSSLADRIRTGIGLTVAMQAMNSMDHLQAVEGMGPTGEIRLVPDPDSFVILPYAPNMAAMLVDHVRLDGKPYEAGPRNFLQAQCDRLARHGLTFSCAVENEFSLATRADDGSFVPIDSSLCFSTIGMTASAEVADTIVGALAEQGILVEQYYAELGHGQQELSVRHAPAVQAADRQILVRETIRGVASSFGLVASLAPKPWPDQAGNGAHVHFSLWDAEGRNALHDPSGRYGLSQTAERFVAGILAHVPGLLAITAPSFNSYQRLQPQYWSSAFSCWGPDNREATLRVPSTFWGMEAASTNLEFKPTDASGSPYLTFGALIAAGLDGLEHELSAPDPMLVDPATLTDDEREAAGAHRYPTTLGEALGALEKDDVLTGALGDLLTRSYLAVRWSEWEAYSAADPAQAFRDHFLKY
jgi:glutamine synthetase